MRNQPDTSKKEIGESINGLIKVATRLSLAIESDSDDSSDEAATSSEFPAFEAKQNCYSDTKNRIQSSVELRV